jgi:hypothetical protein
VLIESFGKQLPGYYGGDGKLMTKEQCRDKESSAAHHSEKGLARKRHWGQILGERSDQRKRSHCAPNRVHCHGMLNLAWHDRPGKVSNQSIELKYQAKALGFALIGPRLYVAL